MKIALLGASEESAWRSSRLITNGLRTAYFALKRATKVSEFSVGDFHSHLELLQIAERIIESKPDLVVFLDTLAPYGAILRRLTNVYAKFGNRPALRFHVYGDFTVRSYLWTDWSYDLKQFRVEFACASSRQRKVVESALVEKENSSWVCPFALNTTPLLFSPHRRTRTRRALKLKANERLVLYAGRMSFQKNIPALIRAFANLEFKNAKLILAGEFDDIGTPVSNAKIAPGRFHDLVLKELNALPKGVRKRIDIRQGLSSDELLDFYNAADVYLNVSLQHDEDFGMAPAEASVNGLNLVLTNWGGFSDFKDVGTRGKWIPVSIGDEGSCFDIEIATLALEAELSSRPTLIERRVRGEKAAKYLSIQTATSRLQKRNSGSLAPAFQGFTDSVSSLAKLFNTERGHLVFDQFGQGSVYEQVYKNYV